MDKTLKAERFRDVFQNSLKINARTISIKTLLSERNLKRINYTPYYQRNYVWDNTKQTFFIESVILGTEIPPLILFKTGSTIEVIDGRQRFETLKRFKENDFSLHINGLKELQILNKQSFNKLSDENKDIFLNSNIRVFEFEVINQPNLSEDIIDKVKKEIFRRYNTGITPLTKAELDNAKYDEDYFSELFKRELKNNRHLLQNFNKCFFPSISVNENSSNDGIVSSNVDYIRRFRILNSFPISTYAQGSNRTEVIDILYDFAKNNTSDVLLEFEEFKTILNEVIIIHKELSKTSSLENKLIFECILWALTILKKENIDFKFEEEVFKGHYLDNIIHYSEDNSHYYSSIINRYSDTAKLFEKLTNFNFSIYIKDESFRKKINKLKQTEVDAAKSIQELSNLRLHKPNPISTPVDEIRNDIKSSRYLLRPSYQRQEKINTIKASSIIESILLGISLPPIFIYKRTSGVKEVVDGQQRILAIIGFLGEQFFNEDGVLTYSKNNSFKLKELEILTDLENKSFSELSHYYQDKLLDFVLDLIIIEESVNSTFDPIDLFIRLNYKPYPIKNNSFEMWNSTVNFEVVSKIKNDITKKYNDWFFLRETIDGKPDRMENEELITYLSYISYNNSLDKKEEVLGFFPRQDRITCRLKDKKVLSKFLTNLDNYENDKIKYLEAIDRTDTIIRSFRDLFNNIPTKDIINEFLNVKKSQTFRRSLQDFYVIWIILDKIPSEKFSFNKEIILSDIKLLLSLLRNVNNETVDQAYLDKFKSKLDEVHKYYLL